MHLCVSGQVFLAMWAKFEDRPWHWHEPLEWGIAAQMARDCQVATPQRETPKANIQLRLLHFVQWQGTAIFPASATLIEKHARQRKAKVGLPRVRRGRVSQAPYFAIGARA